MQGGESLKTILLRGDCSFRRLVLVCCGFALVVSSAAAESIDDSVPPLPREFRGVWVATAWNIDWPSKSSLAVIRQQEEVRQLLDRFQSVGLNAVLLQVRSFSDAIYPSTEPWSRSLGVRSGDSPSPAWDPLSFWIREAHVRGLELHAWFNPLRADAGREPVAETHVARRHPDLVVRYGTALWLDPGFDRTIDYVLKEMEFLLQRYDVDGLHLDDYFYPYPKKSADGSLLRFPDERSYREYTEAGGVLPRDEWRRSRTDRLVMLMRARIRRIRPEIRFGIAPFGLPCRRDLPQMRGLDPCTELFTDAAGWCERSWCDYLSPQLYWRVQAPQRGFRELLSFWSKRESERVRMWPGLFTARVNSDPEKWPADEIVRQIQLTRELLQVPGHTHFSARSFLGDELADVLRQTVYRQPAAVPIRFGLEPTGLREPAISLHGTQLRVQAAGPRPRLWVLQTRGTATNWNLQIFPGRHNVLPLATGVAEVAVSGLDERSRQGPIARLRLPQHQDFSGNSN